MRIKKSVFALLTLFALSGSLHAFDLNDKVKEFTLDNGWRVIYMQRPYSPTIAIRLLFLSGSTDEPANKTGLAHLIEHMMFKGTKTFGTKDYNKELPLLLKQDSLYAKLKKESKKSKPDSLKLTKLQQELDSACALAREYIKQREISEIYEKAGAVGLNAATSKDYTMYVLQIPSNKLELWARVTADIIENTVFRGFYEEKNVVIQEVKMHKDEPSSLMNDELFKTAFKVHPYGKLIAGQVETVSDINKDDLTAFCKSYYIPSNGIIGIVGDVSFDEAKTIITKYFSHFPKKKLPPPTWKPEPVQTSERRVTLELPAEPQILIGYHTPTYSDSNPDAYILDVLSSVLSRGRTSRLHKQFVETNIAASAYTYTGAPGKRYPNLFVFKGAPAASHTIAEIENLFYKEIDKMKTEPVTDWELNRIKNDVKAQFLSIMSSNQSLVSQLLYYEGFWGGWEKLNDYTKIIDKVTAQDIINVANKYFTKENRTVITSVKKESGKSILDSSIEYYEKKTGKKIDDDTLGKLNMLIDNLNQTEKAGGQKVPDEQKLKIIRQVLDRVTGGEGK
ncbi:MAG: pitrilysin family protein [bacterium]